MDQLSAHLEHAWDLAQRGDARGAEASARQALALSPDTPEVHNLLGFVATLDGDCDEAVEAYQQAIALDESYVEAMLNAAELLVHPLGQPDEAISLCHQALDITDYPDEVVDAVLLLFEAFLSKGAHDQAKKALAGLPDGPVDNPAQCCLIARAYFETGDFDRAGALLDRARAADPGNAEVHYYQALLCEERGDDAAACAAFLRVRQLEIEAGMPTWAPDDETFRNFTERAVAQLPAELADAMLHAQIYVADVPGIEAVVDGIDPRALSLIESATPTAAPSANADVDGLRVFIYALNIMRTAGGLHAVTDTIREALLRELQAAIGDSGEADEPCTEPEASAAEAAETTTKC